MLLFAKEDWACSEGKGRGACRWSDDGAMMGPRRLEFVGFRSCHSVERMHKMIDDFQGHGLWLVA